MNTKNLTAFFIIFFLTIVELLGVFEAPFSSGPYTYPYTPYASYYDSVGFYYGYDCSYDPWYNHCNCSTPACYSRCDSGCFGNTRDYAPYYYQMGDEQSVPTIVSPKLYLWITTNSDVLMTKLNAEEQGLHYTQFVDHIPQQDFSGHKNAFLLIVWETKNYPFAFTYRVFHASTEEYIDNTSGLEKATDMLYEGQANHYYLEKSDMHPQLHNYIWVQVLDDDGNVYAQSDLVLVN